MGDTAHNVEIYLAALFNRELFARDRCGSFAAVRRARELDNWDHFDIGRRRVGGRWLGVGWNRKAVSSSLLFGPHWWRSTSV